MQITKANRWTKEQLKLAFHLYCQLPFGRLHSRNPEIIGLAELIGRTPAALAMKLVNFASLDPAIVNSGRSGLGNASALDLEIWDEFHADWGKLALECEYLRRSLKGDKLSPSTEEVDDSYTIFNDYTGEVKEVITEQRIKQSFFRRAVLSSYRGRCCMSGLPEKRLLNASHIVPWSKDKANRLNPSNGLCLSAIHDKAFDRGLITLTDDFRVLVSNQLKKSNHPFLNDVLVSLDGKPIDLPERFTPNVEFVSYHRKNIFSESYL